MATLSIEIPNEHMTRILDGVCAVYGYEPGSGLTKAQFVKQVIVKFVKSAVKNFENSEYKKQMIQNTTANDAVIDAIAIT